MKVLITGGAGFIGSNFVHFMSEKHPEYEIVVLDALTYAGRKENLQDVLSKITFIKGDITKKEAVEKAVKGCDSIINFAASTHVDRSVLESGEFILTNIFGVHTLLETCRKFEVGKMIQISTDEVYGHILEGSFNEGDRLNPRNPYSSSKASADLLCKAYFETYGMPVMITRSTNNFGFYQHPEKFIPKCIIYTLLGRKIPLYGKGENVRDWIPAEDNCEAIDLVLRKGKEGEIYNIAGKQELKNIEIARIILKLMGKTEESIEFVKDRPGHDLRYSLEIEKIKNLGWCPKTGFEENIVKTISWYRENKWWWKPVLEKQEIDFHGKY